MRFIKKIETLLKVRPFLVLAVFFITAASAATVSIVTTTTSTVPVTIATTVPTGINLGDLTVSPNRIPRWYPFDETVYYQARSWPEYDATCSSAPCVSGKNPIPSAWGCSLANPAANGTQDASGIRCIINNVPNQSVIYLPNGTYEMGLGSNSVIIIGRSNVVLRGQHPQNTKILIRDRKRSGACNNPNLCGAMGVSISSPNFRSSGITTAWTGGYAPGTTVVTVQSTAGFQPGDWVTTKMAGATGCEYIDNIPGQASQTGGYFEHIVKIVSISGNQITIDRGLRMDYNVSTCGAQTVEKLTPIENVGLENFYIGLDPVLFPDAATVNAIGKFQGVALYGAVNSWVTNNFFNRFDEDVLSIRFSARNWLQGNWTQDVGANTQFNTDGFYFDAGSVDNVMENNIFLKNNVASKQESGSEGNISAYNYMMFTATVPGALANYRQNSLFHHGRYTREQLWEGNHADTSMLTTDRWWGRNGPRITAFRNRIESLSGTFEKESINTSRDALGSTDTGWIHATEQNWIGNISTFFFNGPATSIPGGFPTTLTSPHDFDQRNVDMFAEKNVYINPLGWQQDSPEATTDCGTGVGNCPGSNPGPNPSSGTNVQGKALASWASDVIPNSLYRGTTPPSWWCMETISAGGEVCEWNDVHNGIGAWGDDYSSGSLCKLPAQVHFEGGPCTPFGGSSTPPPPPPPPPPTETIPPVVTITAPGTSSTLSGTVNFSATATDASGIAGVLFTIDGTTIISDTSQPYLTALDTTLYSNGTHTLAVIATDTVGNTATQSITVTITNTTTPPPPPPPPPPTSTSTPPSGSTPPPSISFPSTGGGSSSQGGGGGSGFGGTITYVAQTCVLDTPAVAPTTCSACPLCTGLLGSSCAGRQEILFTPAPGSAFNYICPILGFPFSGGIPAIGMQILGTGQQIAPTAVGVGQ